MDKLEMMVFEKVTFWIQVHGLPVGMFSEKIDIVLGESIGEVLKVNMDDTRVVWGRYVRIRVILDVTMPLTRGTSLSIQGVDKVVVLFRYERLPDLCFVCGRLNHHESECDMAYQLKKRIGKIHRDYGS
ncbi:hypothetical protein REPUB_Repub10bG0084700 [Reevesia pubescens]